MFGGGGGEGAIRGEYEKDTRFVIMTGSLERQKIPLKDRQLS